MDAFSFVIIVIAALGVFAVLAARFGVDSRPDFDDPRRSAYPVAIS